MLIYESREQLFRVGLFELATGLCQQANGASDPWDEETVARVLDYLRGRLGNWHEPHTDRSRAARAYVEAAIADWTVIVATTGKFAG